MEKHTILAALSTLVGSLAVPAASAQEIAATAPVVYRLEAPSSFASGCVPPCLCPVQIEDALDGTFALRLTSVSGNVFEYAVDRVNWILDAGGSASLVTGAGTYTRTIGFAGTSQQLVLDLSFDGGPSTTYDSGVRSEGRPFPAIDVDVTTGGTCLAAWFHLEASPVPRSERVDYRLVDPSTYQEGCFPPCLCPLAMAALRGRFQLVPLIDHGTFAVYAVVDARFRTGLATTGLPRTFRGAGLYTLIQGFAGPIQQLRLHLSLDGGPPELFDSGLLDGGELFPELHVLASQNGLYCLDQVIDLHALPITISPAATTVLTPAAGQVR